MIRHSVPRERLMDWKMFGLRVKSKKSEPRFPNRTHKNQIPLCPVPHVSSSVAFSWFRQGLACTQLHIEVHTYEVKERYFWTRITKENFHNLHISVNWNAVCSTKLIRSAKTSYASSRTETRLGSWWLEKHECCDLRHMSRNDGESMLERVSLIWSSFW